MPLDYNEFAEKIKAKYPEYKDVDNYTLASKMVEKYPEYAPQVDLKKKDPTGGGSASGSGSSASSDVEIFTGYPGKEEKPYKYKNGKWYEESGVKIYGQKEAQYAQITDPNRIKNLNRQFNKGVSVSQEQQIYTNYDEEKKDNLYRIENGRWERQTPGSEWHTIENEGSINALNKRYGKSVSARTTTTTTAKPKEFKDITSNLVAQTEESAIDYLNKNYSKYGFEFSQEGAFFVDQIKVKTKDGRREETFEFDSKDPKEAARLRDFLQQNASKQYSESYNKSLEYLNKPVGENKVKTGMGMGTGQYGYEVQSANDRGKNMNSSQFQAEFKRLSFEEQKDLIENEIIGMKVPTTYLQNFYKSPAYQDYKKKKISGDKTTEQTINVLYDKLNYAKASKDPAKIREAKNNINSYLTDEVIQDNVKQYDMRLNDLQGSVNSYKADVKKYESEVAKLNQLAQSGNITQEEYNAQKSLLEDRAESIQTTAQKIEMERDQIIASKKKLNVVAGKYIAAKEKEGNILGFSLNKVLSGVSMTFVEPFANLEALGRAKYDELSPEEKAYYKSLTYNGKNLTRDQIENYLDNQAILKAKKEAKESIIKAVGDEGTTLEYMNSSDRGFFTQAIGGVLESLPAMATGVFGKAASFAGLAAQAYSGIEEEMLSDRDFQYSSVLDRALIAVPYAAAMGALENIGLTNMIKADSYAGKVLMGVALKAAEKVGGKATKETLEKIATKEIENMVAKGAIKITQAGLAEFETGATQALVLDQGWKNVANWWMTKNLTEEEKKNLTNNEFFNTADGFIQTASQVFEDGVAEMIGGKAMATVGVISERLMNGNISLYNEDDVKFLKSIATDTEFKKLMVANLKSQMINGDLTKSQAQEQLNAVNKIDGVMSSMPEQLSDRDRMNAFNLIVERDRLQQEIDKSDPALVTAQKERVAEINNQLDKISKDAVQKQAAGEVPVQPGTEISGEMAQGEPETGLKETTQKAKEEVDQYIADMGAEARLGATINPIMDKMSNAEFINDNDIDTAIEAIFNEVEQLDKSDQYSPETKAAMSEKLLNIADKLDNYEFRTKTETVATTKAGAASPTRRTSEAVQKIRAEKYFNGVQAEVNGQQVTLSDNNGRVEAAMPNGEVIVIDTPTMEINEDGFEFDDNGALQAVVVTDRLGNTLKLTGEQALDFAIRDRENKLGVVEQAEFEKVYQQVEKQYIKEGKAEPTQVVEEEAQVEEAPAEEVQAEEEAPKEKVNTEDNLITEKNAKLVSVKFKRNPIVRAALNIMKALPGVKIYLHENTDQYASALADRTGESKQSITKENSAGSYIDGEIHIDMTKADMVTLLHEAVHHAFAALGVSENLFIDLAKGLRPLITDKARLADLDAFIESYDGDELKAEEFMAQLGGILADNREELTVSKLTQFKALINRLMKKIGLGVIFKASATTKEAADLINAITFGLTTGENILTMQPYVSGVAVNVKPNAPMKVKYQRKAKYDTDFTTELPTKTLKEVVEKYDGRVFVIQSDATGVGYDSNGDPIYGGIGYIAIKDNVDGKIGFASVDMKTAKTTISKMINRYGANEKIAVLVMAQNPSSTVGNYYGGKYFGRALIELQKQSKTNYKAIAQSFVEFIESKKSVVDALNKNKTHQKLIDLIKNPGKYDEVGFAQEFVKDTTFDVRREILKTLLPEKADIRTNKSTPYIKQSLKDLGFNRMDFLNEYGDNTLFTEEMYASDEGGLLAAGFEMTLPSQEGINDFTAGIENKGIKHHLFNGKLPYSDESFLLDGLYPINENFSQFAKSQMVFNEKTLSSDKIQQLVNKRFPEDRSYDDKFTNTSSKNFIPRGSRTYTHLTSPNKIKFKEELQATNPEYFKEKTPDVATDVARGMGFTAEKGAKQDALVEKAKTEGFSKRKKQLIQRTDQASEKLQKLFQRDNMPLTIQEAKEIVGEVIDWTTWYDGLSTYVDGIFGEYAEDVLSLLPLASMAANSVTTVSLAISNAERIYQGEMPKGVAEYYGYVTQFLEGQGIKSDKMSNFFKALTGDKEAIAVDSHVWSIIMWKNPNKKQVNPKNQAEFEKGKEFVRVVASELGLAPREVQAALWAANILRTGERPDSYEEYFKKQLDAKGLKERIETWRDKGYKPFSEIRKERETTQTTSRKKQLINKELSKASGTTQVATTTGSYSKVATELRNRKITGDVLDYGAGLGLGTDAMSDVLNRNVDSFEINVERWKGRKKPTYTNAEDIDKKYEAVVSLNVINVVPKDIRDFIIEDIFSKLKNGGVAYISSRGFSGDIANAKNFELGPEDKSYIIKRSQGGKTIDVFQKGFDGNELLEYVQELLGDKASVIKDNSFGSKGVVITKLKETGTKLAPNGKPSNLTDKQWEQVRTPEFKAWFGDWENDPENASKVVDENGEPRAVYHGTQEDFDEFTEKYPKHPRRGYQVSGYWFTSSADNAENYTRENPDRVRKDDIPGQIYQVFLNIRKPIIFDMADPVTPNSEIFGEMGWPLSLQSRTSWKDLETAVYRNKNVYGADGVIFDNIKDTLLATNYQLFEANQIKSATANVGTFSPNTANIKFQKATPSRESKIKIYGEDFTDVFNKLGIPFEYLQDIKNRNVPNFLGGKTKKITELRESLLKSIENRLDLLQKDLEKQSRKITSSDSDLEFRKSLINKITDKISSLEELKSSVQENLLSESDIEILTPVRKQQKAPKILGGKPTQVIVKDEYKALLDQIKLEARAQREQKREYKKILADISATVTSLKSKGNISVKQFDFIMKKLKGLNFDNKQKVSEFIDYVSRALANAEYIDNVQKAKRMSKAIASKLKGKPNPFAVVAKMFTSLDAEYVENIVDHIAVAQMIMDGVKSSSTRGGKLTLKQEPDLQIIADYIDAEQQRQTQRLLKNLQARYENITWKSAVNKSAKDMLEELEALRPSVDNSADILDQIDLQLAAYSQLIDEDTPQVIIDAINIDAEEFGIASSIKILDALDTYFANGATSGIEALMGAYEGMMNAKKFRDKSSPMSIAMFKKLGQIRLGGFAGFSRILERKFRSVDKANAYQKASGINKIIVGANKADFEAAFKQSEYIKKFHGIKGFKSNENIYERGIIADLIRTNPNIDQDAEFDRLINILMDSKDMLLKSQDSTKVKMGKLYDKVFKKLGLYNANVTLESVLAKAEKSNIDAVNFAVDMFAEKYDQLSDTAMGVYNIMLNQDINYTPKTYANIKQRAALDGDALNGGDLLGLGQYSNNYFNKNEAGVLMPITRPSDLKEKGKYVDLNFDNNMFRSYRLALTDSYTAKAIRQLNSFYNSRENEEIIGSEKDFDIIKSALSDYINDIKGKNLVDKNLLRGADKFFDVLSTFGSVRALAGIGQWANQFASGMSNTIVNAGEYIRPTDYSKAAFDFMNRSGQSIANVGENDILISLSNFDKSIDKATLGKNIAEIGLDKFTKFNAKAFQILVSNPDAAARRIAWMAYYRKYAAKNKLGPIDFNAEPNADAAAYAQSMVDRSMDMTDSRIRGDLYRSKNTYAKLIKSMLFPFSSFGMNQKTRMWGDLTKMFTGDFDLDTARSLASISAEIAVYNVIRFKMAEFILWSAMSILGYDDEEKEELVETLKKNMLSGSWSKAILDVFSPLSLADNFILEKANQLMAYVGVGAPSKSEVDKYIDEENNIRKLKDQDPFTAEEEKKKREKYIEENSMQFYISDEKNFGTLGIQGEKLSEAYDIYKAMETGEFIDNNERTAYLDEEGMEKMKSVAIIKSIGLVAPIREADQIANKSFSLLKKSNRTSERVKNMSADIKEKYGKLDPVLEKLAEKKKKMSTIDDEMDFIKTTLESNNKTALTEDQKIEYAKILEYIPRPTEEMLLAIKANKTADQILKK